MTNIDYDTSAFTEWVEEQTGINLEFVLFPAVTTESLQQFTLMANGNEKLPDVLWTVMGWNVESIYELGNQGYLVDLRELIENYAPNYKAALAKRTQGDQDRINTVGTSSIDGGFYALPFNRYPSTMQGQSTMLINQKWLDAVGKEVPTTIEELYEVLEAFANEDPNGNGKKDEIPMVGTAREILGYIANAYTYINMDPKQAYWLNVDENGKLYSAYTSDAYREALKIMADMTEKGYINTQTYALEDYPVLKNITSNPSTTECIVGITASPSNAFNTGDLRLTEYVPMYELEAELEGGGYYVKQPPTLYWPGSITKDCENPELAMQLLDFLCSDDAIARATFGIYGTDWQFVEGRSFENAESGDLIVDASLSAGKNLSELNRHWGGRTSGVLNSYNSIAVTIPSGDEWRDHQATLINAFKTHSGEADAPEKVIIELVYTEEENEIISASKTLLTERFVEATAQFATGVLDPNSDADWKTYLDSVEDIGLTDFLKVAQQAYDRANGR